MDRRLVKLTLPNDASYLPLAQAFVRETAVIDGFTGKDLLEMEVALEETFVNVITHGQHFERDEPLEIACERIPRGIKIVVHETGIPFDPGQVGDYRPGEGLQAMPAKGLGTHLIRQLMNEVRFENLGPGGKQTILVKYRAGAAEDAEAAAEPAADGFEPEVIQEQIPYTVRGLDPAEAIEISRCAYKSHGYSFFDDHIYYPDRLVSLNASGEMVSAVAVTEDNRFMGHAAFLYQSADEAIAELTFVFVNVEYRGQGIFKRLIEYLFACPKQRPLAGIYAYAVANHVFTQKAMMRYGINDCGPLLATSPNSWKFKGIAGDGSQRISVVLSFKYLEPPQAKDLYVPQRHRAIVERLYQNLGATEHRYRAADADSPPQSQLGEIESSCNELESCAEIFVRTPGTDVVKEVRRLLRSFCLRQIACINLFLNLEDPGICVYAADFEQLGFFFAGVLPGSRIGEALILQYLNNVAIDYAKIQLQSEMAKELCRYIQACDPHHEI